MISNRAGRTGWGKAIFTLLCLIVPCEGFAKTKNKGGDFDLNGIIRPDLINAKTDPALRFPVMPEGGTVSGVSYGWLDISNSTIRYTAVQPKNKSDRSFAISRLGISDLRLDDGWVIFRNADKKESLASAFRKLSARNLSLIPVVEEQRLVGIVTLQNLMHSMALLAESRKLRRQNLN